MPIDRPTFDESWYRVAAMRPRVRTTLRTYRQHYRGETYHVLEDPGTNDYYRINEHTYKFVGLLDGQRTIADAWAIANETMGDMAPTQREVIQVLANLYMMNLLEAEIAPDVAGMFDRFRKRKSQELRGQIMNVLFLRIPLINPNRFLDKFVGVVGHVFSSWGLLIWFSVLAFAIARLFGRGNDLMSNTMGALELDNLPLLGIAFAVMKLLHEFGHAFACKKFGRDAGTSGQVHTMGVMFLVLAPFPYVDASSAWGLRNKWHRAWVGAAGMYVELFCAAIAAIIWSYSTPGTVVNSVCYNVMFISSIATILFNANPLIRFDGYYILSDLLEMPNLYASAQNYLKRLFKKYAFGIKRVHNPAHNWREAAWLFSYGIAALMYRFLIITGISMFVAELLGIVGVILAVITMTGFFFTPIFKFMHYLLVGPELMRHRLRAIGFTSACIAAVLAATVFFDVPDRARAQGVTEPIAYRVIRAETSGFITDVLPTGRTVTANDAPVVTCENQDLVYMRDSQVARLKEMKVRERLARTTEPALAQALQRQIEAMEEQIADITRRIDALTLRPPLDGTWLSPNVEQFVGRYVHRGEPLGMVADLRGIRIRVVADQYLGPRLREELPDKATVELRVKGRAELFLTGTVERILPAASQKLLTPALGYTGGGSIPTDPSDPEGRLAMEPFFELWVTPDDPAAAHAMLMPGQIVIARFDTEPKPLLMQWVRRARQILQERFQI